MSSSLWPHELQHARLPSPSLSPRICLNSCPLSQWCHPTISSSVTPSFPFPQSFPASGSLSMSQLFASDGQSIGASATALSTNIQSWFLLRSTGLISLLSKGLLQVFCSTTVRKRQFLDTQPSSMTQSAKRKNDLESEMTNIKYSKLFGVITTLFLHLFYITASLIISLQNFFLIVFRRRDIKSLL